jgi:hypothetical protein
MNSIIDDYQIRYNPKGNKILGILLLCTMFIGLSSILVFGFFFSSLIISIIGFFGTLYSFFVHYSFDRNYCAMHWFSFTWKISTMSVSAVVWYNLAGYFFYYHDGHKATKLWVMTASFGHSKVKKICEFIRSVNPHCTVEI